MDKRALGIMLAIFLYPLWGWAMPFVYFYVLISRPSRPIPLRLR